MTLRACRGAHQMICTLLVPPLQSENNNTSRGVSHCGLAIYMGKSMLRQKKKNYGNSNISPCKNILFKKSSTNLKFQHKPKYHLSKILI
jgi:hypothetical protein